ncbi:hypothetical protein JP0044_08840 [Helicobacter pylori]|uniref:hypothetical protein n=1 Tax=Helicobacter pylori TaxID=210 RepID=UPI001AA75EFE|nr:hypothetical protein [Helicobacter pylori]GHP54280.1 hypothetical protein JP0044_08840 [Helicobacter pylori]
MQMLFVEYKCHFIGFVKIFIEPSEILFFVYENEPSATFNLKNFLLVLVKYNAFVQSLLKLGSFLLSCCFMDDKNLKDLKKLLSQDQINLSNVITTAINNANAFEINEINLTSAIIDKIEYHFRDNTFHFIFNVSNNFLSGKSRLTIEVPRVELENIKLPDMKEIYVNQWYIDIFINTLIFSINEGFYILTGV